MRRSLPALLALLLACGGETPSSVGGPPSGPPAGGAPQGPPPGGPGAPGGPPGPPRLPATGPEDLASSWSPALAVAVPPAGASTGCPDADRDGAPSALACPGGAPATLDCDDADPAVGPATERWVPPGPFLMGSASDQAGADERPVHVVRISGYCLDRTEVSAGDFGAWLATERRRPSGPDVRSVDAEGRVEPGRERHPAEGATWAEARGWCAAHGKALPTEAQWEKAARGGCEGGDDPGRCDPADLRAYPWGGEAPTCALANHNATTGGPPTLCVGDTVAVDTLPDGAGPYGHLNLAGNVWEYVADAWHPAVYGGERVDPGGPAGGEAHVLRGGGWNTFSTNMRAANRFHDLVMGSAAGFRCARPTVAPTADAVEAVRTVALSGTIARADGVLAGRALYVTAFDAADADPRTGMVPPGRSPVAEVRLDPAGGASQAFALRVPAGGAYLLYAALDDGSGAKKGAYVAASGSGGFGAARENPVRADGPVEGLHVELTGPPPGGPPGPPPGSASPPGPPPGPPPR